MKNLTKLSAIVMLMLIGCMSTQSAFAQSDRSTLKELINIVDSSLPIDTGYGIKWTQATYVNNSIVFSYTVSEKDITISELRESEQLFKDTFLESFWSDLRSNKEVVNVFKNCQPSMELVMKGLKTGKVISIYISSRELLNSINKR